MMFKCVLRSFRLHKYHVVSIKEDLRSYTLILNNAFTTIFKPSEETTIVKSNNPLKDNIFITLSISNQIETVKRSFGHPHVDERLGSQTTATKWCGSRSLHPQLSKATAMKNVRMSHAGTISHHELMIPLAPKTSTIRRLLHTSKVWAHEDRPWERCVGRGAVRRPEPKEVAKTPPPPPPLCNCPRDPCAPDPHAFMDVTCKRAIVTGGASGIGLAASCQLLDEGADCVLIVDRDDKAGRRAVRFIKFRYGPNKAFFAKADVSDKQDFECVFKAASERFRSIDILVNNAAVFDERCWQNAIKCNVKSVMYGCGLAMKCMSAEGGGKGGVVVNVAAAMAWDCLASLPIFCATKKAVLGITESFGHETNFESSQVRVLSLCPGHTKTRHLHAEPCGHLDPEWAAETKRQLSRGAQPASAVGHAVAFLARYGCSAAHYVVENSVISQLHVPSRHKHGKYIATFL